MQRTCPPTDCYPCHKRGETAKLVRLPLWGGEAWRYECPKCGHINRWNYARGEGVQRKDITDAQVVAACVEARGTYAERPLEVLMRRTGACIKVAHAAMERAVDRGLIEVGVSVACAWETPKGIELLEQERAKDANNRRD